MNKNKHMVVSINNNTIKDSFVNYCKLYYSNSSLYINNNNSNNNTKSNLYLSLKNQMKTGKQDLSLKLCNLYRWPSTEKDDLKVLLTKLKSPYLKLIQLYKKQKE